MIGMYHWESEGRWGVKDYTTYGQVTPAPEQQGSGLEILANLGRDFAPWAQSVSNITETVTDPVRQIAVLSSQLHKAKATGAPLWKIQQLEGKLAASQARLERRDESDLALGQWRTLGMVGGTLGIVLLGTIILFVATKVGR